MGRGVGADAGEGISREGSGSECAKARATCSGSRSASASARVCGGRRHAGRIKDAGGGNACSCCCCHASRACTGRGRSRSSSRRSKRTGWTSSSRRQRSQMDSSSRTSRSCMLSTQVSPRRRQREVRWAKARVRDRRGAKQPGRTTPAHLAVLGVPSASPQCPCRRRTPFQPASSSPHSHSRAPSSHCRQTRSGSGPSGPVSRRTSAICCSARRARRRGSRTRD